MNITKATEGGTHAPVTPEDLACINRFSRRPLTQEEVYTFSVRLCDNEIDRDFDRFAPETLEQLAGLFVGKCGIFDHDWSARGQSARIFRTQVIRDETRSTRTGDPYCYLKGWAYMVRTEENAPLIAEIEGGIKKEVSVGCAVARAVCSICGADERESCGHQKGTVYDGALCFHSLEQATDAYEFSFVAVPAQPQAGIIKGRVHQDWRAQVKDSPQGRRELEALEQEAEAGRLLLGQLREDVIRLGLLTHRQLDRAALTAIIQKLELPQLQALHREYASLAREKLPITTQLSYDQQAAPHQSQDNPFLI